MACDPGSTKLQPPKPQPIHPAKPGAMIKIRNGKHERMGEIIRDWVRGHTPVPTTISELKCQLEEDRGDVVADVSPLLKSFRFCQPLYYGDYIIPLPHIDELEAAMADPGGSTGQYELPEFYERHFKVAPLPDMELLLCRIGDYTIASCM